MVSINGAGHVHDLLSEYVNDNLVGHDRQVVESHLQACDECRRDYESLRLTVQLVRQMPSTPVPRSFAIAPPEPRRAWQLIWLRWSSGVLAATFVALLALQLVLPTGPQPGFSMAAAPADRAVQQSSAAAPTIAPAAVQSRTVPAAAQPAPAPAARGQASSGTARASSAAVPTAVLAAAPASAPRSAESLAAAPTPTAAASAKSAGLAPMAAAASQPQPTAAATPAVRASAPAGTAVSDAARTTTAQSGLAATKPTTPTMAKPTAAEAPQHVAGLRPITPAPPPPRSTTSRPIWYVPLLGIVGTLLVVSASALIWFSRRA